MPLRTRHYLLALGLAILVAACEEGATAPQGTAARDAFATSPLPQPTLIATGNMHACAIDTLGVARCWGLNQYGDLGGNPAAQVDLPVRVLTALRFTSITAGYAHTCAIATTGDAYCWGTNAYYNLGSGSTSDTSPQPVLVPGGHTFVQLAAGSDHTCGVTNTAELYCWGYDGYGQLGDSFPNYASPIIRVGNGIQWKFVASGSTHSCGISTGGAAFCWGNNASGQLGHAADDYAAHYGPERVYGTQAWARIAANINNTCGVTSTGTGWCWGDNGYGQLGVGQRGVPVNSTTPLKMATTRKWLDIVAGYHGECGLDVNNTAFCWGTGASGVLGGGPNETEDTLPHKVSTMIKYDGIVEQSGHVCAHGVNLHFYCWGDGRKGQNGNGADSIAYVPVHVKRI